MDKDIEILHEVLKNSTPEDAVKKVALAAEKVATGAEKKILEVQELAQKLGLELTFKPKSIPAGTSSTHRPMKPSESGLVAKLKNLG